jgi:hypothetical protein
MDTVTNRLKKATADELPEEDQADFLDEEGNEGGVSVAVND